ncbi:unnamed protein product [Caretta caretta]
MNLVQLSNEEISPKGRVLAFTSEEFAGAHEEKHRSCFSQGRRCPQFFATPSGSRHGFVGLGVPVRFSSNFSWCQGQCSSLILIDCAAWGIIHLASGQPPKHFLIMAFQEEEEQP